MKGRAVLGLALLGLSFQGALAYDRVVDIYTGFSTEFANANGGSNSARAKIINSGDLFNQALFNPGIDVRCNLVGLKEYNYRSANGRRTDQQVYADLRQNRIGSMIADRNLWGADKATFFGIVDEGGGVGDIPGEYSVNFFAGDLILAHEVGHNFGCGHGYGYGGTGFGEYTYSEGYRYTGSSGRRNVTIMVGNYEPQNRNIARFSHPGKFYDGRAYGAAEHDNARTITTNALRSARRRTLNVTGGAYWNLVNRYSNHLIDNWLNSQQNGTPLKHWNIAYIAEAQWQVQNATVNGYKKIRCRSSGRVMDSYPGTTGSVVKQWSDQNNQWQQHKLVAQASGHFKIKTRSTGTLLALSRWTRDLQEDVKNVTDTTARYKQYEFRYVPQ